MKDVLKGTHPPPNRGFNDDGLSDPTLEAMVEGNRNRLTRRPTFRIRTRITLAFLVVFVLCAVVILWVISTLSRIEEKIHFLEVADSYVSELQQARRFEKNFLLYGTNLDDARDHLRRAQRMLRNNRTAIEKVLGRPSFEKLTSHVERYSGLLRGMTQRSDLKKVELRLRVHGSEMINLAMSMAKKERDALDRAFVMTRRIPFIFLGALLVTVLVIVAFLTRQFLVTLARFMEYAKRIGEGDFSPISPKRKYQDEFSQLALAFNQMIYELESRHRILVESHKLRAIGNLVAGVAHELNNPLNNIMLTAAMMKEDLEEMDEEQQTEMLDDVISETERSQKIVRNLLDFARESEITVEPLHLHEIVENAVRLVHNQVKMAKVKLDVDIGTNLPPIHGDSQMLCQVFVNLILNAVDALPERGRILIRIYKSPDPGFLAVDIEDNGHGIPAHKLDRIFEPFYTSKVKGKGTGLGLSVSRGIVRKLGGFIRVHSTPGEGTTFTVALPTTEIPFERRGEAAPAEAPAVR